MALPDEYKEKAKQEAAEASHVRYETGTEQASEFAEGEDSARFFLAENSSVGLVEDVSEDFSQMNRGQDRFEEDKKTGYSIDRTRGEKGYHRENRDTLTNENKILKACLSSLKS